MSLVDFNDIRKTQHDIFQNNIDWVAKQVQTINDLINGVSEEEDGSEIPAVQPLYFRGVAGIRIGGSKLIDPSTQQDNIYTYGYAVGVANASISGEYIGVSDPQYIGRGHYLVYPNYDTFEPSMRNYFEHIEDYMTITQKEEITNKNIYFLKRNQDFHLGCYNQDVFVQTAWDNSLTFLYGESGTSSDLVCGFGYYCTVTDNAISNTNLTNLSSPQLQILKEYPVITNNSNNDSNQNYYINLHQNNSTYNTYNYTSNNGDTYNIMVGGGGNGLGGSVIIPFAGGMLNYVDIENMFKLAIDDLNVSLDWSSDGLEPLYFPSYDDVKYTDKGSFYIEPIQQLPALPDAPDLADTVIDVSEPLGILSTGFGALLDSFNNIGVTLTLTFTFFSCLIINKLRGD